MAFVKLYRVISILGVGAFGVVLEVENQLNREISALKVIILKFIFLGYQQKGSTFIQTA